MDRLSVESSISLTKWQAADNIDLNTIMQEFESFYEMKYSRTPRLVRPATGDDIEEMEKANRSRSKRPAVPLPPLPAGMGSTPSAIPAGYRSSYSAVDGYQGNSMDTSTGMTNSGGGSIESQSVGGGGGHERRPSNSNVSSSPAASASLKDRRTSSAKGSKAEKMSIAAVTAAVNDQQQQQPMQSQTGRASAKKEKATSSSGRDRIAAAIEFSIQGNGQASLASNAAAAAASTAATPSHPTHKSSQSHANIHINPPAASTASSKHRPTPSPGRAESPDDEIGDGKDHASYFETRSILHQRSRAGQNDIVEIFSDLN